MTTQMDTIAAISPAAPDYDLAGSLAGDKAGERYLLHVKAAAPGRIATADVAMQVFANEMASAVQYMREKGATEANLNAWQWAYAQAVKRKLASVVTV